MTKGILYGVGVGPGDPELMTLKAVRILKECGVIALPQEKKEECVAYQIAVQAAPEIEEKESICLPFPMTKDRQVLEDCHSRSAKEVARFLGVGKDVAFLTLGDASIYSTYLYIHERVSRAGFEAQIVNGIPSFCAAASRLGIGLVDGAKELHVIPASYQVAEALKLPGVKVLMKAGRQLGAVKKLLREQGSQVVMVENCGLPGEKVYYGVDQVPENAGYYSLLIVQP